MQKRMCYLVNYYAYDPANGNRFGYVAFDVFSTLEAADRGIRKSWPDKRNPLKVEIIGNFVEYCGGEFGELFAKVCMAEIKD